jgi:hypothetical protein
MQDGFDASCVAADRFVRRTPHAWGWCSVYYGDRPGAAVRSSRKGSLSPAQSTSSTSTLLLAAVLSSRGPSASSHAPAETEVLRCGRQAAV